VENNNYKLMQYIRDNSGLTPNEKLIGMIIISFRNNRTGRCNPGTRRISQASNLSQSTVNRAIKSLINKQVLDRTIKSKRASGQYEVMPLSHSCDSLTESNNDSQQYINNTSPLSKEIEYLKKWREQEDYIDIENAMNEKLIADAGH